MGKSNKTYAEKCGDLIDSSLRGAKRIEGLGKLSDALGKKIGDALSDPDQFRRHIVTEKGKGKDGEPTQQEVEKVFEKFDFKSVKDAAGAISAVAESMRSVYRVPEFRDVAAVVAPEESKTAAGRITVSFESGEEYGV